MRKDEMNPQAARHEAEIFNDLQRLCCSPGFIHAIAYICWRDNLIRYAGEQITEDDLQYQYSSEKLIRSKRCLRPTF
jgi:hypothetical protein